MIAFHSLKIFPVIGTKLIFQYPETKKASRLRCLDFKMVVGDGFEPSKAVLADLQSAPFGRSGIPPKFSYGAGKG